MTVETGSIRAAASRLDIAASAVIRQVSAYFESLKQHGSTEPFRDRMAAFDKLNDAIGLPEMLATADRYAAR
ncbi:helix-turn-helix domain-containing protein [Halomonas salipaludis]|uniref:Uncharacterized protein n=1 Tax=Halomonas salipaludis TaxID=2032625 RepID=A0A2A2F1T0_9GAMM|nr:LysR family transcriptional regulator [Halomonas salipaludis]PAU79396.1 hypothetical protein CK498_03230 [Halomonas salipaludis]